MGFTMYGRRLLLDCTFMEGVRPTTVYYALTVSVPSTSDDASMLVEPGGNYARASATVSGGFYATAPGELANTGVLSFPTPATDWGLLRGWAMCTTSAVGTGLVIVSGPLKQPRRASAGTALKVGIDALRLNLR